MSRADHVQVPRKDSHRRGGGSAAWIEAMHRYFKEVSHRGRVGRSDPPAGTPVEDSSDLIVASVMTAEAVTVRLATPYKRIADLLREHAISAVPVLDALGAPVGVVSEADLITKHTYRGTHHEPQPFARRAHARWRKGRGLVAQDLMTEPLRTIGVNDTLVHAAEELARTGLRRLFVTSGGMLVGVLSRRDLLRVFDKSDDDLCTAVEERLGQHTPWTKAATVHVNVTDGVVMLLGSVPRRSEADRTGRLAADVPGVVMVRNRLSHEIDDV